MREIKFRGKCIETGDWLYGALFTDKDVSYIISEMEASNDYGEGTDLYATWWAQVHPESVGQYTGLKDKNGAEIYEGDITTNELYKGEGLAFTVYYDKEKGMFKQHPFMFEDNGKKLGETDLTLQMDSVDEIEVIGNTYTYENPELLEDEIIEHINGIDIIAADKSDIDWFIERVQELENINKELEYASKHNGELNEFLQKRKLPPNMLGRHVVDVVMDYVEELEEENLNLSSIENMYGDSEQQNKRYREALKGVKDDIETDYTEYEIHDSPLLTVILEQIDQALEDESDA